MYQPIEELEVYAKACSLADEIYALALKWPRFAQNSVGLQLTRSADSVGANLVEGDGRESQREGLRFFDIARGSSRETQYWLARAASRSLLDRETSKRLADESATVGRMITGLIQRRRRVMNADTVRESLAIYDALIAESENTP